MAKNPLANAGDIRDAGSISGSGRSPGEGIVPTPVFFPGQSQGQRSLTGYIPWARNEADTTEATQHVLSTQSHKKMLIQRINQDTTIYKKCLDISQARKSRIWFDLSRSFHKFGSEIIKMPDPQYMLNNLTCSKYLIHAYY